MNKRHRLKQYTGFILRIVVFSSLLFSLAPPVNAYVFQQYLVAIPNQFSDETTTLFLRNKAASQVTLSLMFVDQNGQNPVLINDSIPANAMIERPLAQMVDLSSGIYTLIISSDQPVQSMAQISSRSKDRLAVEVGQSADATGSTRSYFGPFDDTSTLFLFNPTNNTATATVDFFNNDGALMRTYSTAIASNVTVALINETITPVLPSGIFRVVVSSDVSLIGVLKNKISGQTDYDLLPGLSVGSTLATFPRALKHYDNDGDTRSSQLFIANLSTATAMVQVIYTNGGQSFFHDGITLPPAGFTLIDMASEAILPSGSIWAVLVESDQPIGLTEVSASDLPDSLVSIGSYSGIEVTGGIANILEHLYLNKTSFLSVQNLSTSQATAYVDFYNLGGTIVHSQAFTIPIRSSYYFNLGTISGLDSNYQGWARISADQPILGTADLFTHLCTPREVVILQDPAGDLFVGDSAQFSVDPTGETPFSYAWTLNGNIVGDNSKIFTHQFNTIGDQAVGVTVSNACGQTSDMLNVRVKQKQKIFVPLVTR